MTIRLGVNVDHVATLRNARGEAYPCPIKAACLSINAGADSITAHLREDRRHIRDDDIEQLAAERFPLNLEMAATAEMQEMALKHKPHAICLVPEKREELTTEGGLNVAGQFEYLKGYIAPLSNDSRVSLFVDPDQEQLEASKQAGAAVVELHTGTYAKHCIEGDQGAINQELKRLEAAADKAHDLGLEVHAGHGLTFKNVKEIAALPHMQELNIGHFLIAEAVFLGIENSVREMRRRMHNAKI